MAKSATFVTLLFAALVLFAAFETPTMVEGKWCERPSGTWSGVFGNSGACKNQCIRKNRKASSGSKSSDGSGRRMKEVACPTCTVHLQVQVPSSGSETIECGVCQHPFLVNAH